MKLHMAHASRPFSYKNFLNTCISPIGSNRSIISPYQWSRDDFKSSHILVWAQNLLSHCDKISYVKMAL